ncbi:MAG: rod shape-determining protein MreD [Porticoccaceae bacterium]|nr:rod shape-determining protein MreD [Porticoccaceae bacterium]
MKYSGASLALILSIFAALVLQLIPVSGDLIYWRPNFLLLLMIALIIFKSDQRSITFAASMGFLADLVFGSPLGLNILLFSLVGAVPLYFSGWLVYFTLAHRCLFVFLLVIFSELMSKLLFLIWLVPENYNYIFMVALASAVVWPLFDISLRRIR